jgi:propanol-preferring alcohol dehydrogenase
MWSACGHCEACLSGMETVCRTGQATGYSKPGGYAEYMVAKADFVARLPKRADLTAMAPILCAGVTTYRGLKRTSTRPGQWIAVVGIGGLGHIAVQYAAAMGMRVAAVATQAFEQAIGMLRVGGSVVFLGLPGGKADELRASIAQISGRELSVRGSSVGTRLDLEEAVAFALRGEVAARIETAPLTAANAVLDRMRKGKIVGRVVLTMA